MPADACPPERPHTTDALLSATTVTGRLAVRRLTRYLAPAAPIPGPLRYTAIVLALIGCAAALHAAGYGIPAGIAWPVALPAPLLPRHLSHRRGACTRGRDHTLSAVGDRACRNLQRRTAPHPCHLRCAAGGNHRTKVLTEVGMFLTSLAAEQPFWPGDGLLPPLCQSA
ncbi:hypothetical protein [Streptomyces adustus]|uniref:hypothetical protein n=1 Tax=Streptomyces adustus TaxID=1609272 RepID=UPI003723D28E